MYRWGYSFVVSLLTTNSVERWGTENYRSTVVPLVKYVRIFVLSIENKILWKAVFLYNFLIILQDL